MLEIGYQNMYITLTRSRFTDSNTAEISAIFQSDEKTLIINAFSIFCEILKAVMSYNEIVPVYDPSTIDGFFYGRRI